MLSTVMLSYYAKHLKFLKTARGFRFLMRLTISISLLTRVLSRFTAATILTKEEHLKSFSVQTPSLAFTGDTT
jgi:hypothetical protein